MGMEVFGKKPDSEVGEYFRNNVWWWSPLARYCCEVAPEITSHCEYWQRNDGDGLGARYSKQLAKVLREKISSGETAKWKVEYDYLSRNDEYKYPFSVENVEKFCAFLEHCGGFEIC
jgi:hypothetical protein